MGAVHDVELLLELSGVLLICQKKKQRRMKMKQKQVRSYSVRFPSWVKYAAMRRVIAAIKKQRLKLYTDDYGGSIFHVHPTGERLIYILRPKGVKSIR